MSILKYKASDGSLIPVGLPPGIVDWKNIVNKPMFIGNSELSTNVDVITLAPGTPASALLVLNNETNQFELTLSIPRGADGAGGSGEGGGVAGYSPTIKVTEISGGYTIAITDVDGTKSFDIYNGVSAFKIASENGFGGDEFQFNKLLGALGTLNYVLCDNVTTSITNTDEKVPTAKAVLDYVSSYISNEIILLVAELSEETNISNDQTEPSENIEETTEPTTEIWVTLEDTAAELFEANISTNKPIFLTLNGADLRFYYIGNRTFFGDIAGDFVSISFPKDSLRAKLKFTKYLSTDNTSNRISTELEQKIPTGEAVMQYVREQVSDTVNLASSLPITSQALVNYLKDNPEIITLKASILEEAGINIVYLDSISEKLFLDNKDQSKPIYLHIIDTEIYLYYIGSNTFLGYAGGQFIIITFTITQIEPESFTPDEEAQLKIIGHYQTTAYVATSSITNSFEGAFSDSLPTIQAILDYLPTQITEQFDESSTLPPTVKAIKDYFEAQEKILIIPITCEAGEDSSLSLTINIDDFELISSDITTNKLVILKSDEFGLLLTYERQAALNGTETISFIFSGLLENNLVSVCFSAEHLTSELVKCKVLQQDMLATDISSPVDTIPTMQILKDYIDSYGDITIPDATTTTAGLLSAKDKLKLDSIAEGANNYTHPTSHPMSMISGLPGTISSINTRLDNIGITINNINENKLSKNVVGEPRGIASLDSTGKVPKEQLPEVFTDNINEGYYNIDDKLFYEDLEFTIAIEPIQGNYYVDKITSETYRYSGSMYVSQASDTLKNIRELNTDELNEIINCRV